MTTVTAKKLRENLSEYLDKLQGGEEIVIIRHSEIIGVLKPIEETRPASGATIGAMLSRNRDFFESNRQKVSDSIDTKDLYHQALDSQYK